MVGRRPHVEHALRRDGERAVHHDVLEAAVVGAPVVRGQAGAEARAQVEVAAQHHGGPPRGQHGAEEVAALGPRDRGAGRVQVRGARREVGRVEAEPGPLLRVGGVLHRVGAPRDLRLVTTGEDRDPVLLAVAAARRAAGAAVRHGPERGGAVPPGERGGIAAAHLVERDDVGVLRLDHVGGGGDGPSRVAAREAAVAEVHLQDAHVVAPPGSRRAEGGDEDDARDEQAAPRLPPGHALHPSAVPTNVHRVLARPDDPSRRCRPREDARYELRAAPCEAPPGSRDHPGNVRGHRTSDSPRRSTASA